MKKLYDIAEKLVKGEMPDKAELACLIDNRTPEISEYLAKNALAVREKYYGKKVYIRGLIEFTNYCKNDCFYCGIRKSNQSAHRFRLSQSEILECCKKGYGLGFRTFVLQGGEDGYFTDERVCSIVSAIKTSHPDCAVTLSIGEKSSESYLAYFNAGADRYLLRHETASGDHYARLHPKSLSLEKRMSCLESLKKIGYQVGTGFMVGSPYQTAENLAEDLLYLKRLDPQMVGIGPFIPHCDTPFKNFGAGSAELTLFLISVIRLMLPRALIPATTALGTALSDGRVRGMLCGANVVMPNLSPQSAREKYMLYNNKISAGEEAAESVESLKKTMAQNGFEVVCDRGDFCSR